MGQVLHGNAGTTAAMRRSIQNNQESLDQNCRSVLASIRKQ